MLPGPLNPPRPALSNLTNAPAPNAPPRKPATPLASIFCIPTPPPGRSSRKRPRADAEGKSKQRLEEEAKTEDDDEWEDETDVDSDAEMVDASIPRARKRNRNVIEVNGMRAMGGPGARSRIESISTRPILQSFVSSEKSDTYKCYSVYPESHLTPPYACQYSHGAKRGGTPHLAVATEQGTVYIYNTSKRQDWEYEPQRTTLQPHHNGIFALSWSPSDSLIATSSGDHFTRVTDVTTCKTLYTLQKHLSTVKCNTWNPDHEEILMTGGRDGNICVWDLRVPPKPQSKASIKENGEILEPVVEIKAAHGGSCLGNKKRGKNSTPESSVRSVTDIFIPETEPYGFISSGSFDGILRHWDIRSDTSQNTRETSSSFCSPSDPTTFSSTRPRGIISLTPGSGPTAGLLFALGIDWKIHTYTLNGLAPLLHRSGPGSTKKGWAYEHPNMRTNDFYVRACTSPCGRWVACGGVSTDAKAFLFDVSNSGSASARYWGSAGPEAGVELRGGHRASVGALDWAADGMLATCLDDGTVRVWRPDVEVWKRCSGNPEERKWDYSWAVEEYQ